MGEFQSHLGRGRRLAGLAPAENDVLHPLATQALGALLTEHPRDGIDDVALAAAVRADDGGDALVESEFGALGKALETGNVQFGQSHFGTLSGHGNDRARTTLEARTVAGRPVVLNGRKSSKPHVSGQAETHPQDMGSAGC